MSLSDKQPQSFRYPRQPLQEVDCEIRFFGEPIIEARRHEFYEAIRDEYPLVWVPQLKEGTYPALQRYQFVKQDNSAGVSLALNSFAYFQREYQGAEKFINEVIRLFEIGNRLFSIQRINRVGWRYINTIPFTRENSLIPLARIFKDPPNFFSIKSHEYLRVNLNATTTYEDEFVSVKLESDNMELEEKEILVFDIDVSRAIPDEASIVISDIPELINRLHRIARNFFEASITDQYRNYISEETHE